MPENGSAKLCLRASRASDGRARVEAVIGTRVLACDVIDLWSDDDRDRLADAIHAEVPALELKLIQRELLLIDRENLPTIAGADEPWGEPVKIDQPKVPAFPVDVLPEPMRAWVDATAEACQVPSDLPGLLALAVCAGAVARRVEVLAGRNWFEPINLFVAVLLEPANRKSAVFSAAMRPLRLIESELIEQTAPEVARLASDRRIKETALKSAEKKAAGGCAESRDEAQRLASELAVEPVGGLPKLIVDDATPEAIEATLATQNGRLVVAGCEGGLFDVMAGRYSSGVGNFDCFLKGHAGDDLRVDRITRGSVVIDRCCLTLAYAVQSDVVRNMAKRPSFRGRGLIGRFLYAVPETRLGLRRINAAPVPRAVADAYEVLVRRLAAIEGDADGRAQLLSLSPDASSCFADWQAEVERWLGDDGRLAELRDWGGKLCGLTARLAAIMHLVETDRPEPWAVPISLSVMRAAIELGRWAVSHAEAVIGLMGGTDGPTDDAVYSLRWLRERASPEVTRRDAHVHGRARFDGEPERLDDAIELLVERGWLRPMVAAQSRAGRPASPRYAVHPLLSGKERKPVEQVARVKGVI